MSDLQAVVESVRARDQEVERFARELLAKGPTYSRLVADRWLAEGRHTPANCRHACQLALGALRRLEERGEATSWLVPHADRGPGGVRRWFRKVQS